MSNLIRREDADHIGTKLGGQERVNAFGATQIYVYAAASSLINTPYPLIYGAFGAQIAAIGSGGAGCELVVPVKAIAASGYGWATRHGLQDVVITDAATATDGDAIKIHTDGKPISDATPWIDDVEVDQWGVAMEAKGTATAATVKCYIVGREITWV